MGTPEVALRSFEAIAKRHEVVGLFCGADVPVGRKQRITPPPTKIAAEALPVPVFQPVSLRKNETIQLIKFLAPDLIVVLAYGRILPKEMLEIPRYGVINAHASLLPAYRGAAPIQHAIMNGEIETGVSIMRMDEGIDTGDIILTSKIPIDEDTDAVSLFDDVSAVSASLLLKSIDLLTNGTVEYIKQDDAKATYAPLITKNMGEFDFILGAKRIDRLIKGLCIWPVARFEQGGKKIKVLKSSYTDEEGIPKEILSINPLTVATSEGAVIMREVMPESKGRMTGTAYAAGMRFKKGDMLE